MAIVQISKIQHRSGNIVDLPQLDEAEFGWASDAKRLFIGKTVPDENVEVLTSYSNISFSQINGAVGNLDISAPVTNGQVLTYDGTNWVNRGGSAAGNINLGDVSNVKITGGAISYVLETDGTGNLSWTPKSSLIAYISNITKANPAVVTTTANNYFTNSTLITITDVSGMTQVNGNSYYVDVLTSNTFALYSDSGLTTPIDSSGYSTYTGNGRAISSIGGASGSAAAGGSNTTVQFNNNNILDGDTDFTWNFTTNLLTINGNANVGNLNASGSISGLRFSSNIANGTAPFTVVSTTQVANLYSARANVSDFGVVTPQTTGTYYPTFVNANTSGNLSLSSNANLSFNVATGNLSTVLLSVTSNANVGNLGTAGLVVATGNVTGGNLVTGGVVSATGNITGANINTAGNVTASRLISNIANGTAPLTVTSTTRVANLNVNYANVSDFNVVTTQTTGTFYPVFVNGNTTANYALASNANISVNAATGALAATLLTGTLTTATQPNITSLGTLTSLTTTTITTGANTTAGTMTGNWTLTAGSRFNATYADLAEYYTADADYQPGTVVEFGGDAEVTLASDGTNKVAGVVSTNPAYAMNAKCEGDYVVALALQGRVPCKVRGTIVKGDMMISAGGGYARPASSPQVGTVIGKALENYSGTDGVIEVAVGRL